MQKNGFFTCVSFLALTSFSMLSAQDKPSVIAEILPQTLLNKSAVPTGDYSGLSHIRDDLYAVVSDKEQNDGFYPFTIKTDSITGHISEVHRNVFVGSRPEKMTMKNYSARDEEDIIYHPSTDTYFIAGEGDQRIIEYSNEGKPTGRELQIPQEFMPDNIRPNAGFESLAYDAVRGVFWTTTETALKNDSLTDGGRMTLRLQSFGEDLKPAIQYAYQTDAPSVCPKTARQVFGVSALTALPDGRLLVLERDFVITKRYIRSYVKHKIYMIDPLTSPASAISSSTAVADIKRNQYLKKTLVAEFQTNLKLFDWTLANYEGMCLGPQLADGRRVLLLINDSQHNYGNVFFSLQDYVKVILLKFQ